MARGPEFASGSLKSRVSEQEVAEFTETKTRFFPAALRSPNGARQLKPGSKRSPGHVTPLNKKTSAIPWERGSSIGESKLQTRVLAPASGWRLALTVLIALGSALVLQAATLGAEPAITILDPPESDFFSKEIICKGIPIKAHRDVSDAALREASRRLGRMLEHIPVIVENLVNIGAEMHIIGKHQVTSDLPSLRHYKGKAYESYGKTFESIDARTRGVGGLPASCAEENLLKLPSDRYRDHRDICTHEFAHTLLGYGLSPDVRAIVHQQFEKSMAAGLWKTTYASTNDDEFFAELSMWYFGSRGGYGQLKPKPTIGRSWLRQYDPGAFAVLDGIYSGRTKVARVTWEKLVARPPEEEHTLKSLSSAEPTVFVVDNRTSHDLSLFWLDYQGERKASREVRTGSRSSHNTFATHAFLLTRPDGSPVAIFVATKNHCRAIVTDR
jgi:hypothetical protein